jgi:hypothetical protein
MAFCPECRLEYPPAIVMCRSCGGQLSEGALAEEGEPHLIRLVSLAQVAGLVEGSMLIGALESQGLHPRLVHHMLPAHGAVLRDWGTTAWGDIRVPETEVEEARLVLEDFREAVGRMDPLGSEEDPQEDAPASDAEERPAGAHLKAVPPPGAASLPSREEAHTSSRPVELLPLCSVSDVAEGKMLEGALKSQGLHPVLAEKAAGMLSGKMAGEPHGEIRMPPEEILEARAVLEDFRRALARSRRKSSPPDTPPEG